MADLSRNFEIDPNNYLSLSYDEYISKITTLSLVKPQEYLALRQHIKTKLHRDAINAIYKNIFNALTKGQDAAGNSLFDGVKGASLVGSEYSVSYPNQLSAEISASAAKTLKSVMEEVINLIIPDLLNGILSEKLSKLGKTDLL